MMWYQFHWYQIYQSIWCYSINWFLSMLWQVSPINILFFIFVNFLFRFVAMFRLALNSSLMSTFPRFALGLLRLNWVLALPSETSSDQMPPQLVSLLFKEQWEFNFSPSSSSRNNGRGSQCFHSTDSLVILLLLLMGVNVCFVEIHLQIVVSRIMLSLYSRRYHTNFFSRG